MGNFKLGACIANALLVMLLTSCDKQTDLQVNGYQLAVTPRGDLAASEQVTIELFEKASPSVVQVVTRTPISAYPDLAAIGAGSGFVWDEAGHVITNNHVVDASEIIVRWPGGAISRARVVGRAPNLDIAVLALEDVQAAPPLPLGTSKDLKVGQAAFAIGNPFGLDGTLTTGVVSALERRLPTSNGRDIVGVIQTDAAINPGSSGGPLLDSAGRLIGVTTAIVSPSGANAGVGFAVPIDAVARIVPQLIETGHATTPGIGILSADETTSARLGVGGVLVWSVFAGMPAARAGLRGTDAEGGRIGDIITGINGKRVDRLADLTAELDRLGVGATADLDILRGDQSLSIKVPVEDIGAR
jgi:2-alkenal reductase